ncbi:MAG: helix-turn-helix domain-containing protein [Sphingobacteriales bacterium]|jgi:hypothetical protein
MEVITIESQAFQLLLEKIDALHAEVQRMKNPVDQFVTEWIDGDEVMKMLNISRRTLCNYVNQGKLHPRRIQKRSYFKIADIKDLLEKQL